MYNAKQKDLYINSRKVLSEARSARQIFERLAPYEEQRGYDICYFSMSDIIDIILAEYDPQKYLLFVSRLRILSAYKTFSFNLPDLDINLYMANIERADFDSMEQYGRQRFNAYQAEHFDVATIFHEPDILYDYLYENIFKEDITQGEQSDDDTVTNAETRLLYAMLLYFGLNDDDLKTVRKTAVECTDTQCWIHTADCRREITGKTVPLLVKYSKAQFISLGYERYAKRVKLDDEFLMLRLRDKPAERMKYYYSAYCRAIREKGAEIPFGPQPNDIKSGGVIYRVAKRIGADDEIVEDVVYPLYLAEGGKPAKSYQKRYEIVELIRKNYNYLILPKGE